MVSRSLINDFGQTQCFFLRRFNDFGQNYWLSFVFSLILDKIIGIPQVFH